MATCVDEEEAETAQLHIRKVAHTGGINRVRSCPQQPHVAASWADTAQVQVWDLGEQLGELRDEAAPAAGAQGKVHRVNARHVHTHSSGERGAGGRGVWVPGWYGHRLACVGACCVPGAWEGGCARSPVPCTHARC